MSGYWISELGGVGYLPDQDEANGAFELHGDGDGGLDTFE